MFSVAARVINKRIQKLDGVTMNVEEVQIPEIDDVETPVETDKLLVKGPLHMIEAETLSQYFEQLSSATVSEIIYPKAADLAVVVFTHDIGKTIIHVTLKYSRHDQSVRLIMSITTYYKDIAIQYLYNHSLS